MAENKSAKKPFYKQIWFWGIVVLVLLIGIVGAGGQSQDETESDNESDETSIVDEVDDVKPGTEEWLNAKVSDVLVDDQLIGITYNLLDNFALIKFNGVMSLTTNMTVGGMYGDIFNILKAIRDDVAGDIDFNVLYPITDVYGNIVDTIVIKASFKKETIKKINFSVASYKNIPAMADSWWSHPSVKLSD